ncbi:MAG: toxin-antitoxin system HicB family antitoxin [Halanaerobiales bacterium]|nr:toxin-antitoxin system HicB family antitoxin [Halanaerobiales bacterium]
MKILNKDMILARPYRMRFYPDNVDGNVEWNVEFPDLPGCVASGDTLEEALELAQDAKRVWLEIALEDGKKIPKPDNLENNDFSGKFTLRLPKSLHRELTLEAEEQGVSLNQYILFLVTKKHYQSNTAKEIEQEAVLMTEIRQVTLTGNKKGWNGIVNSQSDPFKMVANRIIEDRGGLYYEPISKTNRW